MTVRKLLDGKWNTIIDIYPDCISLITEKMAEESQIPRDIYDDYLKVLFSIERMRSAYSSRKRYMI